MTGDARDAGNEQFWRDFMARPDTLHTFGRHLLRRLPTEPRCQVCAAPFTGAGGAVMRVIGKRPSEMNPALCMSCESKLTKHHGGADIDAALLFADIRGSTATAESNSPSAFRALLDRFYTVTSEAAYANGGFVNKFVGDELVAAFVPVLGPRYADRAIQAARAVLRATGHARPEGPWVSVGAGVHSGRVWIGAVGQGHHTELTFVGDVVNTTSRLAAQAEKGEILVSRAAAELAGLPFAQTKTLQLKGKAEPFEVTSIRVHE